MIVHLGTSLRITQQIPLEEAHSSTTEIEGCITASSLSLIDIVGETEGALCCQQEV